MYDFLTEAGRRQRRPTIVTEYIMTGTNKKWHEDIRYMTELAQESMCSHNIEHIAIDEF
jgi:hypothetical protein